MPYALRNLLRNAFKYAARVKSGSSANSYGDQIAVHVDGRYGIGIPEGDRDITFFSPSTRLDRSRDPSTGGLWSGPGAICQARSRTARRTAYAAAIDAWWRPLHPELESAPVCCRLHTVINTKPCGYFTAT
jgi:hypothetical protein